MKILGNVSARKKESLPCTLAASIVFFILVTLLAAVLVGCGGSGASGETSGAEDLTAEQVLQRSVEQFMSLTSYRYRGTSSMSVAGNDALSSESEFDTLLVKNDQGGMDGHMVVTSKGGSGSYETYSYHGTGYTRLEGEEWYRVEDGAGGSGLVSPEARRIVAEFATLVEDVSFVDETDSEYIISMVMGQAYFDGAAEIVGADPTATGFDEAREITMTITVDKETFNMTDATMTQATEATADTPAVTVVTQGTYSEFNEPVDLQPPPEALNAPLKDEADAASIE